MKQNEIDRTAILLGGEAAPFIEENMVRWYVEKHPKTGPAEIDFINSIPIVACPHCGCPNVIRFSKRDDGVQTYKCKNHLCGKRFNPLTNTIFDSRKIPMTEWVEFLIHLFEYHSVFTAAFDNRNADSTGFYWLEKVFMVLEHCQDSIMLDDLVWIDETYISRVRSQLARGEGGKKLRGLSKNQYCLLCATDCKSCVIIADGKGKVSGARAERAYLPHVQCGSHIVHDGEDAHKGVVDATASTETVIPTEMTKGLEDEENPMEPINRVHRFFKKFMARHAGYDRSRLQDWANLFAFIWNGPSEAKIKAMIFISMAVKMPGLLRYRVWKSERKSKKAR